MKIYFTHSRTVPQAQLDAFYNYFTKKGITVFKRSVPEDPSKIDFREAESMYIQNVKMIKSCDLVITETSYVSNDIGYDISLALQEKKPVLAFYNMTDDRENPRHIKNVPMGLKGNKSKYLILKEYSLSLLDKILDLAIQDAKSLVDTKFILIIPPEIDRYLEWNVKEKGLPKAEITRSAIENMMKNDTRYQEYLKENNFNV